ncbi:Reverse transcriptase domain-containing protein [Aphis craccivora]|uniref:Reverse transcriptase domain-containing protein n=1 Tax=Aphis craccivora TaxID=307492 RepID=A0A6G0VU32_APHCR|nr:Reverse transcriptase domain-containing protein [Aphis craccivora]
MMCRREKPKKNDGKTGIFTQNKFSTKSIFLYGFNSKTNHCKFLKFSSNIYVSVIYIQLNFQNILTFFDDSIVPNYYPPLNICYTQLHIPPSLSYTELSYDWSNGNYNAILSHLGPIDWSELFKISNDTFFLVNEFSPNYILWFSKNLINLIKFKKTYHLIYKMSNSHNDYLKWSSTRSLCKALSKLDYSRYLNNTQNSLKSKPKKFWSS